MREVRSKENQFQIEATSISAKMHTPGNMNADSPTVCAFPLILVPGRKANPDPYPSRDLSSGIVVNRVPRILTGPIRTGNRDNNSKPALPSAPRICPPPHWRVHRLYCHDTPAAAHSTSPAAVVGHSTAVEPRSHLDYRALEVRSCAVDIVAGFGSSRSGSRRRGREKQ